MLGRSTTLRCRVPIMPEIRYGRAMLSKLGGGALMASGALFLARDVLELAGGPPPAEGAALLAWVESNRHLIAAGNELLFFATIALVPAVVALYRSLVTEHRATAVTGCGIIAAAIPILAVLAIVQGRLVYPVYGLRAGTPAAAELVVGIFHGALHAVGLMMAVATFVLSLAMRRGGYGRAIAYLGFVTSVLDLVGAYPYLIGTIPTLVCRVFFSAWFVAVGARLYRMRGLVEPSTNDRVETERHT